jgi:hypothetical protein
MTTHALCHVRQVTPDRAVVAGDFLCKETNWQRKYLVRNVRKVDDAWHVEIVFVGNYFADGRAQEVTRAKPRVLHCADWQGQPSLGYYVLVEAV